MPDNIAFDVKLATDGDGPVVLPSGETAANAQFMRDGQDLCLKEIDGHTIRIEGYFAHNTPPDLISADGARLTHAMVDAFLPPQHPGETASNAAPAANDASAVGKITDIVGDATITHADGSHARADVGAAIHMGDVIETSAKGAVHILFADNTTFAISESARLSIDNFTYNPDAHTGTSFFTMLHGVFVYTSGLIGKNDPGSVNIETPVGSIGIRGTVIAGDINPAGHPSTITIVDGAIVVTNGGGTLELSSSFDTATLTSYSAAPVDSGAMSAQSFDTSYSAVAPVDPAFYPMTGTTPPVSTTPTETAPTTATPDTMTQATPSDTGTTVTVSATTAQIADPFDPTVVDPGVALTDPTLSQPVSASTFTTADTSATFGTTATSSPTSFTSVTTTSAPVASDGTLLSASSGTLTTVSTSGTVTLDTTSSTTTTLSGGPASGGVAGVPASAAFAFSGAYLNGTIGSTADDGLPLLGQLLAPDVSTQSWAGTQVQIGVVTTTGLTGPVTYTVNGVGTTSVTANAGGFDISGDALTPVASAPATLVSGGSIIHLVVDSTGALAVDFSSGSTNPYAFMGSPLGNLPQFSITATDSAGHSVTTGNYVLQFQSPASGLINNVFLGDAAGPGSVDSFSILTSDSSNNFLFGNTGNDTIFVGGSGANSAFGGDNDDTLTWAGLGKIQLFGDNGNDTLAVQSNSFLSDLTGFSRVDGGAGNDILQVGAFTGANQIFNFEGKTNVQNIEEISIAGTGTTNNTVQLDFQDIFDLTANNGTHQLTIHNSSPTGIGSFVTVDNSSELFGGAAAITGSLTGSGTVTLSGTLVSNGQTVTLIIDKGNGLAGDGVAVTLN